MLDGVAVVGPLGDFLARAVLLRVTEIVAMKAVGLALQQGRPFTPAGAFNRFAGRFIHGQGIHTVHLHAGNSVGRRHVGDVGNQRHVLLRRPLRELVVLAHVYHGQLPHGADVDVLVKRAAIGRTVAEKAHRYLPASPQLSRQAGSRGQPESPGHDAVGAQHADLEIGDVHGAALALAVTGRTTEELGHHAVDVSAFGDAVAVAAMGTGDVIGILQVGTDRHRHAFFTNVGVQGPHYFALAGLVFRLFLEQANAPHALIHLEELFRRGSFNRHPSSPPFEP